MIKRQMRFIDSAGTFTTSTSPAIISAAKLCSLRATVTTTNATATQDYEAVRLRRIRLWAWPPAVGTPASVSITAEGAALGVQGNHRTVSDTSMSLDIPAFAQFNFNSAMQAGQWQTGDTSLGANALFQLTMPAGAVIEIVAEFRESRNIRTTGNTFTITTGILTDRFYACLDNTTSIGAGSSGNTLIPDPTLHNLT